jgi:hypothetical protein
MTKSSLPEAENAENTMQNLSQTRAKCCEKLEFENSLSSFPLSLEKIGYSDVFHLEEHEEFSSERAGNRRSKRRIGPEYRRIMLISSG